MPVRPEFLGYCLNVHPGEAWADQRAALEGTAIPLGARLNLPVPYGLGLRLSSAAVQELVTEEFVCEADQVFAKSPFLPFTVNGFPYGRFHGGMVKEQVYVPDWGDLRRLSYTSDLAAVLSRWLKPGQFGSISTVPVGFRRAGWSDEFVFDVVENLAEFAWHAHQIRESDGPEIALGLEPEPGCLLETTPGCLDFFAKVFFPLGERLLVQRFGVTRLEADEVLRRHVGICLDLCHAAVMFEDVEASLSLPARAGVRLVKVQISNALEVDQSAEGRAALRGFVEPIYLHQTSWRSGNGEMRKWLDLDEALEELEVLPESGSIRVHFHVPMTFEGVGALRSTRPTLTKGCWEGMSGGLSPHLEVETYTFAVLPGEVQPAGLERMLEDELSWVGAQLSVAGQ
jgi:hypothetical protein